MKVAFEESIQMTALEPFADNLLGCPSNLVNDYGIKDPTTAGTVCELSKNGFSMWLLRGITTPPSLILDLGGNYPMGQLLVWNYNRVDSDDGDKDYTPCGLRQVRLYHSIDKRVWKELKGKGYPFILRKATGCDNMVATNLETDEIIDFGGVTGRYLRLDIIAEQGVGNHDSENLFSNSFGLAKLMLLAGKGLYVTRNEQWTELCQRRDGWAGGDGIYSVAINGVDNRNTGSDSFITFGDTLIGSKKKDGIARSDDTVMINNSSCELRGTKPDPANATFSYAVQNGNPRSIFVPDISVLGSYSKEVFFWMQDGIVIGDNYYCLPMLVGEEPSNPEGYQFSVEGIALLKAPVCDGRVDWQYSTQRRCELIHTSADGKQLTFGGAFFSNTVAAGAPNPDGHIYIYGHKPRFIIQDLYVCRVPESEFEDLESYRFYDGEGWSRNIADASPICEDTSCEMSVSPYFGKLYAGKYIMVYQELVNSPIISCRLADSPVGPFGEPMQLYRCPEPEQGRSVYCYNAKGHPHLSPEGSLLVSYNQNVCNVPMNMKYANVYSPRFLTVEEVV